MRSVFEQMRWRGISIGLTSAWGRGELLLGEFGADGPGILITAGIHGDEGPWGGWAIQQAAAPSRPERCWRIHPGGVPLANPLAMQADKRNAPVDQLDLNRVFPGDLTGSYSGAAGAYPGE